MPRKQAEKTPKAAARPRRKPRVPRKRAPASTGLSALECRGEVTPELQPVAARVEQQGGAVLSAYRDPLGGHGLVFAVLPIDHIEPTPFQRDLSEAHHKRLSEVIQRTGRYLDPVIAVPAPDGGFWTPNGYHRLEAMRRLGARAIAALIVPEEDVARQILALNTEKAHNLKERSLEVIRIYRSLVSDMGARPESEFAFYLEEAALVTTGVAYERKRDFAGSAYHSVLRRVEDFTDEPVSRAIGQHEHRADLLLALEEKVAAVVEQLKERGLKSPYLRPFVVARINPLRFQKGELPPPEAVLETMIDRASRFNVEKIRPQDLSGGYAPADEA